MIWAAPVVRERGSLLTKKERAVGMLVAKGLSSKEVARRLGGVSNRTIDTHRRAIRLKTGLTGRADYRDYFLKESCIDG